MTADPAAAFRTAAEAARVAAGIIAARHRGDLGSADSLLDGLPDAARAAGFLFLADLALTLLAQSQDRPTDDIAAELSLLIAAQAPPVAGDRR